MSNQSRNSLLSRKLPLPPLLRRFFDDRTSALRRAGTVAGIMEGTAVAGYAVMMEEISIRTALLAMLFIAVPALGGAVIWTGLGKLAGRFLRRDDVVFRIVFALYALVVAFGRHMLNDRTIDWSWDLFYVGVAIILVLPLHKKEKIWRFINPAAQVVAVCLVTTLSLAGRVPDYSFPFAQSVHLLITSGLVAVVVYAGLARVQLVLAFLLACLLGLAAVPDMIRETPDKPNVLFLLVDTLRRDHVSPYGDTVQTPAIDALAKESVLFDNAVTVIPKTTSSVASIFTGRYPVHNGVRTLYSNLKEDQTTLAETFFRNGYDTQAFVNNAWLSQGRGFAQGFERFHDYYEIEGSYGPFKFLSWVTLFDQLSFGRIRPFGGQTSSSMVTDAVLEHLGRRSDRPFFTYVHYFEPHWPYFPPEELAKRYGGPPDGRCVVNYAAELGVDRGLMIFQNALPPKENEAARRLYKGECDDNLAQVGRLLDGLKKLGLDDDTIVVLTADHGHALGDHDYYFHHGEFLYESSLRVPLIMRWPEHLPAGKVVEPQVRSIDIAPTLYAMADISPQARLDGADMRGLVDGEDQTPREAFLESDVKMFPADIRRGLNGVAGKLRAIRRDRYKLIMNPTHHGARFELYDLIEDPEESVNLAGDPSHQEIVEELQSRLIANIPRREIAALVRLGSAGKATEGGSARPVDDSPEAGAEQPKDLDENELEMLRNLGYIQ